MSLIRIEDVHKTYHVGEIDVPVLRGLSLKIEAGEMVALIGASGSGKTTLMNILGCLDRPTTGKYWLGADDVSALSPDQRAVLRATRLGFVFQSFNLLPRTSALENVLMPLSYSPTSISEKEAHSRAAELLRLVGLEDRMDHEPSQLSGGQQQRVAIARSLINRPPLLLADEPTGNLDSKTAEEILGVFQDLNEKKGITTIIVTHDANVAGHTKRVVRMKDGGIIDEGSPRRVLREEAIEIMHAGDTAESAR
jgi:ABC-type lipoprotein export system ATPase subunit